MLKKISLEDMENVEELLGKNKRVFEEKPGVGGALFTLTNVKQEIAKQIRIKAEKGVH